MMFIYVIMGHISYEGDEVLSVSLEEDKAKAFADLPINERFDGHSIEQWEQEGYYFRKVGTWFRHKRNKTDKKLPEWQWHEE